MEPATLPMRRHTALGAIRAAPVETDNKLPEQSDVVIVGAGANGVMTAWYLAQRGVSVTICEKGDVACEASSRAFGWISGLLLDPSKMNLTCQSQHLWRELEASVGGLGYREEGLCYLGETDEELGYYESWRDEIRDSGYSGIDILNRDGVAARFPGANHSWKGGIVARSDGGVEPTIAIPALARAAMARGVRIVQRCAVRGVETSGGRIGEVVTEHGSIKTSIVLCAANLWSRLFAGNLGIDVPQLYAVLSMGATGPAPDGPVGNGGQEDWAWRRQIDGGYSLGRLRSQRVPLTRDSIRLFSKFVPIMKTEARNIRTSLGGDALRDLLWPRRWRTDRKTVFERHRMIDFHIDETVGNESFRLNKHHFDAFADTEIAEYWSGAITITPDNVAIASDSALPGFYLLTGCAYGLTWSPALGRMMADLITGRTPELDPAPYRLSRFFDGTPISVKA